MNPTKKLKGERKQRQGGELKALVRSERRRELVNPLFLSLSLSLSPCVSEFSCECRAVMCVRACVRACARVGFQYKMYGRYIFVLCRVQRCILLKCTGPYILLQRFGPLGALEVKMLRMVRSSLAIASQLSQNSSPARPSWLRGASKTFSTC